jgi:hypothetical protein
MQQTGFFQQKNQNNVALYLLTIERSIPLLHKVQGHANVFFFQLFLLRQCELV